MTPKEKAKEIFDKYKNLSEKCDCLEYSCICFRMGDYKAKECTLIAVDEILNQINNWGITSVKTYWEQVKQEINNL